MVTLRNRTTKFRPKFSIFVQIKSIFPCPVSYCCQFILPLFSHFSPFTDFDTQCVHCLHRRCFTEGARMLKSIKITCFCNSLNTKHEIINKQQSSYWQYDVVCLMRMRGLNTDKNSTSFYGTLR